MEQTIELDQVLTKKQSDNIKRWEQEEVLLLARHFQRLNDGTKSSGSYYTRTNRFVMSDNDLKCLNKLKDITSIRIYMSLEKEDKTKFTFCPIIKITTTSRKHPYCFSLIPEFDKPRPLRMNNESVNGGGRLVPGIFKEMILTNWNNVEDNLIDDLFVAKDEGTRSLMRVNFFDVSSDIVLHLFNGTFHNNVARFIMYPGIDMNKFQNRNMISFTPVLGIVPKKKVQTEIISRHGFAEFGDEEIFIEYSTPCPPTCPNE
ncbi:hypothetical protein [Aquimarina sp. 2201CG14-23]|uniref:hypothetical protein n=1 Tax=Aquimarina mycalae TaxID=3040073 RepID=UPI002478096D|nr:hypothetical protein [Aquimarina sp. 2201CG14-23]MDH7446207.1 hypothetical protein [Aquimarina sp. 2201CG14-23]